MIQVSFIADGYHGESAGGDLLCIMKKISAAFDGLNFSEATMQYSIQLAKESKSLLSGVFLDEFLYHGYTLAELRNDPEVSYNRLKKLDQKDKETRQQSAAYFEQHCAETQINYSIHHDKGFGLTELLKESIYSDMLVIAADESLSHFTGEHPASFVSALLGDIQCPALVVPRKYKPIEKIIFLYDGQPSSVFAIKMFNYLLPSMESLPVEVLSVKEPKYKAELSDEVLIRELLSCHCPEANYTLLHGDPVQEIVGHLRKVSQNVLIVLGAYQRGSISRLFKKSMADHLIQEIGEPVFIAHHK